MRWMSDRHCNISTSRNALDTHCKEHEKNDDGTQQIEAQINNKNFKHVSFSRRRGTHSGFTESQPIKITQGLTGSDRTEEVMEAHDTTEKSGLPHVRVRYRDTDVSVLLHT